MMFTGIIQTIGTISYIGTRGNYRVLTIKPDSLFDSMTLGESIAVDGCCLTVTGFDKDSFTVEASHESVNLTIIRKYTSGWKVNLERALLLTDRMGGHMVTGHVDCVGEIRDMRRIGESTELSIYYPEKLSLYLVSKGSVAINGISLTVNELHDDSFTVNVIPHTLASTNIGNLKRGKTVNLEFDIFGKYVVRMLDRKSNSGLTIDKLVESGWHPTNWSNND